jgi:hypothetical protein
MLAVIRYFSVWLSGVSPSRPDHREVPRAAAVTEGLSPLPGPSRSTAQSPWRWLARRHALVSRGDRGEAITRDINLLQLALGLVPLWAVTGSEFEAALPRAGAWYANGR